MHTKGERTAKTIYVEPYHGKLLHGNNSNTIVLQTNKREIMAMFHVNLFYIVAFVNEVI